MSELEVERCYCGHNAMLATGKRDWWRYTCANGWCAKGPSMRTRGLAAMMWNAMMRPFNTNDDDAPTTGLWEEPWPQDELEGN